MLASERLIEISDAFGNKLHKIVPLELGQVQITFTLCPLFSAEV